MRNLVDGSRLAHEYFEELLSAPGDLNVADEILHPEVVFENPVSTSQIVGIPAYKQFVKTWYEGFPRERTFSVEEEVAAGDTVAVRFLITARHEGEFLGAPPTGARVEVPGINMFRLLDGRIVHVHAFFNPLTLWTPLGLAPPGLPTLQQPRR
jgi:predicted ester cyclase